MTEAPMYCDISVFNPLDINWQAYKAWSSSVDGIARVAMRSSEGTGYTDQHFANYRSGALEAGIDIICYYHYAYPQFNGASAEADYQRSVVGDVRASDLLMLDYEEGASQATAEWAYEWLSRQEQNYGGKLPTIYASDAYIRQRLQDVRLTRYPLTLANWQFTPTERPPCPPPWSHYVYLQYTDRATTIPGIAGVVDADIYLGGGTMSTIPANWHDDGTTLTAPNGYKVVLGFRDYVLSHNWDPANVPLEDEVGMQQLEASNPTLGGGSRQTFEWTMLEWTADRGVFVSYLGKELLYTRNQYASIYAAYQQLKTQQGQPAQPPAPDPIIAKLRDRLAATGLQAHQLTQGAQALENSISAPIS